MNSKVDVVVCFYKQTALWPCLVWGFLKNKDHINKVIASVDDVYDKNEFEYLQKEMNGQLPLIYTNQLKKDGFGGHKAINAGAKLVTTDYFVHIDGDIVLTPNSLRTNLHLASEGVMVLGQSHDCKRNMTVEELEGETPFLRKETRPEVWRADPVWRFELVRDSYVLVRTEDYWKCGGHDESYQGYGFHDYDYGLRWMDHFGLDSLELGQGDAYHLSDLKPGHDFNPESRKKFIARHKAWVAKHGLTMREEWPE